MYNNDYIFRTSKLLPQEYTMPLDVRIMECESPPAISTMLLSSLHEYTQAGDKTSVLKPHALLYPQTYTLP